GIFRVIDHASKPEFQGTYHMSGSGEVTWCGFARHIFEASRRLGGPSIPVDAISTAAYPTPAKRPHNSRLNNGLFAATFGQSLPDWRASADLCVHELVEVAR